MIFWINRTANPCKVLFSCVVIGFLFIGSVQCHAMTGKAKLNNFLQKMVNNYIEIFNKNGMSIQGGKTEIIVKKGSVYFRVLPDLRGDFFGYIEEGWLWNGYRVNLHFYEANDIPKKVRMKIVKATISLFRSSGVNSVLHLKMTSEKYKKPNLGSPDPFVSVTLGPTN